MEPTVSAGRRLVVEQEVTTCKGVILDFQEKRPPGTNIWLDLGFCVHIPADAGVEAVRRPRGDIIKVLTVPGTVG